MVNRLFAGMLIVVLLLGGVASAEIDLSGMSYEELVALKQRINMAIWECEEWQQVTVPQGMYQVGVDIPEGHWSVVAAEGGKATVFWGSQVNASGTEITKSVSGYKPREYVKIVSPTRDGFDASDDLAQLDIELSAGMYFQVEDASVCFVPFAGKADLGFK